MRAYNKHVLQNLNCNGQNQFNKIFGNSNEKVRNTM